MAISPVLGKLTHITMFFKSAWVESGIWTNHDIWNVWCFQLLFFLGSAGGPGDCKVVHLLAEKKHSEQRANECEKFPCSQPMCAKQPHSNLDCSSEVLSTKSGFQLKICLYGSLPFSEGKSMWTHNKSQQSHSHWSLKRGWIASTACEMLFVSFFSPLRQKIIVS